jgi:hypothetical protein
MCFELPPGHDSPEEKAKRGAPSMRDKDKLYDYLGKKMQPIDHMLSPEGRTDLDGILWAIATELSQEKACEPSPARV